VLDDTIFALVAALAAIGILYFLSNREIGNTLYSAHLSIKETRELLNTGVKVAGLVTFVAVLIFGFWSMIDAHRIAGPMHRLHRLLHEIGEGNLTHEIQFRRKDEFSEIADASDRLVDQFAVRISDMRNRAVEIETVLASDTLTPAQIGDLRSKSAELTAQFNQFCLPDNCRPVVDDRPISEDR
jgi:HAMP domain-containing protein